MFVRHRTSFFLPLVWSPGGSGFLGVRGNKQEQRNEKSFNRHCVCGVSGRVCG